MKIHKFIADKVLHFTEEDDPKRYKKYKKQLEERGFSDSELWGLDNTIAHFIAPRLERFIETTHSYPSSEGMTFEKWKEILNEMLIGFRSIVEEEEPKSWDDVVWPDDLIDKDGNLNENWKGVIAPDATWIKIREEQETINKKRRRALELFCKHYFDLWD